MFVRPAWKMSDVSYMDDQDDAWNGLMTAVGGIHKCDLLVSCLSRPKLMI